METNLIEIERALDVLRKDIPDNIKQIEESKFLICKAQNILQKYIEKIEPTQNWKHTKVEKLNTFTGQLEGGNSN